MAKEKERARNNKIKNKPILVITYSMVIIFVAMIAYVIYFMEFKAETVIANSRNIRQDSFAEDVEKGDIITSDGVVIATSTTDEEGNTTRSYPYPNTFAHVTGYDKYGKSGLELEGNFYMLRSHINIFEKIVKGLSEEKNRGDNVVTTVDFKLQTAAYNAMGYCDGAVIAIEPSSGKIKVMLSKPDYNPGEIDYLWDYLQSEEGSSSTILLNRATQGLYAPGSTFKVMTLLEYIRENPGVTIPEVSEACDVDASQIRQWLREERLQLAENSPIYLNCDGCGAPIRCGKYCERCKLDTTRGFQEVLNQNKSKMPESKKNDPTNAKMRFL